MSDPTRDDAARRHSTRFRKVAKGYPRAVALAYGGDIGWAAADSDDRVAATVAAWERANGIEPRDWLAIGAAERGGEAPADVETAYLELLLDYDPLELLADPGEGPVEEDDEADQ